jgi:hypothetical protein
MSISNIFRSVGHGLKRTPRKLELLIFLPVGTAFIALIYVKIGDFRPDFLPLVFAPAVTFTLSICNCSGQLFRLKGSGNDKHNNIVLTNIGLIVALIPLCQAISMWHGPVLEMIFVVILYGVYWIWDFLMLRWLHGVGGQEANIDEIEIGNRWVNKPSFFTSLFVLCLLWLHSVLPFHHRVEEVIGEAFGLAGTKLIAGNTHALVKLEEEMLVVGLVSFHLFVSALTYFFATSRVLPGGGNAPPGAAARQEA